MFSSMNDKALMQSIDEPHFPERLVLKVPKVLKHDLDMAGLCNLNT